MKEIPLTQGKTAKVSDEDFEWISQWKWYAKKVKKNYYAYRHQRIDGKQCMIAMHRLLLDADGSLMVDHKDGDGLNNQRENIRTVTNRQNMQNIININKTSKFPGVCWNKLKRRWRAGIEIKGRKKALGTFRSEVDAFYAYRKAVTSRGESLLPEWRDY